jgi:hypothetical protein
MVRLHKIGLLFQRPRTRLGGLRAFPEISDKRTSERSPWLGRARSVQLTSSKRDVTAKIHNILLSYLKALIFASESCSH